MLKKWKLEGGREEEEHKMGGKEVTERQKRDESNV